MKIGIFDSGIGGLFVLKEIIKKYPNNEYVYFGDTINLPYGEKSKEELKSFSDKIIKFLMSKKVDIIIIACGTISSNIYSELKDKYNVKIYDIITPVLDFINKSKYKKVGIIGTKRTIQSNFFKEKIKKESKSLSCPNLVELIENEEDEKIKEYIKDNFKVFKEEKVGSIVLGCTHYPYVENFLKEYLDSDIINMGKVLAGTLNISDGKRFKLDLYFSKKYPSLENNINKILKNNYEIKEKVL